MNLKMPEVMTPELCEIVDEYCLTLVAWGKLAREPDEYWQTGDVDQKDAHAVLIATEISKKLKQYPWLANIPSNLFVYSRSTE